MLANLKKIVVGAALFAPYVASAQSIGTLLSDATGWIDSITYIVVALVFIYFIWGLIKYLLAGPGEKGEAKSHMIYSILIMFVIFSIWGLINLLGGLIGADDNTSITVDIPSVN